MKIQRLHSCLGTINSGLDSEKGFGSKDLLDCSYWSKRYFRIENSFLKQDNQNLTAKNNDFEQMLRDYLKQVTFLESEHHRIKEKFETINYARKPNESIFKKACDIGAGRIDVTVNKDLLLLDFSCT